MLENAKWEYRIKYNLFAYVDSIYTTLHLFSLYKWRIKFKPSYFKDRASK